MMALGALSSLLAHSNEDTAMKFLHTADWHLDRQFHNVSLLDDQAHVLKQFVALAHR